MIKRKVDKKHLQMRYFSMTHLSVVNLIHMSNYLSYLSSSKLYHHLSYMHSHLIVLWKFPSHIRTMKIEEADYRRWNENCMDENVREISMVEVLTGFNVNICYHNSMSFNHIYIPFSRYISIFLG